MFQCRSNIMLKLHYSFALQAHVACELVPVIDEEKEGEVLVMDYFMNLIDGCNYQNDAHNECLLDWTDPINYIPVCNDRVFYRNLASATHMGEKNIWPLMPQFECESSLAEFIHSTNVLPPADLIWKSCIHAFLIPKQCQNSINRTRCKRGVGECRRSYSIQYSALFEKPCATYSNPIRAVYDTEVRTFRNIFCMYCINPGLQPRNLTCAATIDPYEDLGDPLTKDFLKPQFSVLLKSGQLEVQTRHTKNLMTSKGGEMIGSYTLLLVIFITMTNRLWY